MSESDEDESVITVPSVVSTPSAAKTTPTSRKTPTKKTRLNLSATMSSGQSSVRNKKEVSVDAIGSTLDAMNLGGSASTESTGSMSSFVTAFTRSWATRSGSQEDDHICDPFMPCCLQGTKDRPFVVYVNPKYPERHRDGFFVAKMEHQELQNKDEIRPVWHIELPVPCLDDVEGLYHASIPPVRYKTPDGKVHRNQVLVRKPSLTGWQRDTTIFDKASGEACVTTKKQRAALLTEIDGVEKTERFWMYYLLVFPDGADLDNSALGDRETLWHTVVGQTKKYEKKSNDGLLGSSTEVMHADGETMLWKIAERNYAQTKPVQPKTDKWGINFASG